MIESKFILNWSKYKYDKETGNGNIIKIGNKGYILIIFFIIWNTSVINLSPNFELSSISYVGEKSSGYWQRWEMYLGLEEDWDMTIGFERTTLMLKARGGPTPKNYFQKPVQVPTTLNVNF